MPYRLVLMVACLVLAARYVLDPTASPSGRWVVGLATALSFALPDGMAWYIAGILTQLSVSLFVLLRAVVLRS